MPESRYSFKQKRIRNFFLSFALSSNQNSKIEDIQDEILTSGLEYIQMKLPVESITSELEAELSKKVEKNILKSKIREAIESDLTSVMNIYNRAWLTSKTPFSRITFDSLKSIFNYHETVILIAEVYGSDAAFIILDFEGANLEYGIIAGLGVLPRFQRKGLGTVIGMAAWNFFKERGVKELLCEVYVDNKASYNFIKSLGFNEYNTKVYVAEDFTE